MKLIIWTPLQISLDWLIQKEGNRVVEEVKKSFELLQRHNKIPLSTVIENLDSAINTLVALNNYLKAFVGKKLI